MARSRNLKPGFFANEDLAECSFAARLCFAGLWTIADREGRLEDRPKRIKGELFRFDSVEVEPLLAELAALGFILRYRAGTQGLIQVLTFWKHQNPHHKEPMSTFPSPQSLGLLVDGMDEKPEAFGSCDDAETQGKPEALVPSVDQKPPDKPEAFGSKVVIPSTRNRADSLLLIPDSGEKKVSRKRATTPGKPGDVSDQTWDDWQQLRKAKRAPVTETVLDGARSEAGKARMPLEEFLRAWCRRGSQGLEAAWLKPDERQGSEPAWRSEQKTRNAAYLGPAMAGATTTEIENAPLKRLG